MSPLGLLALAFAVITFGGGAVVYLYDLLEARLARGVVSGGGRMGRVMPIRAVTSRMPSYGVIVTVKAGRSFTGRGEAEPGRVTVRRRSACH